MRALAVAFDACCLLLLVSPVFAQEPANAVSLKNIKPFILDYDRSNLRLSIVDKGFLIWLAVQDRKQLLDVLGLPTETENPEAPQLKMV